MKFIIPFISALILSCSFSGRMPENVSSGTEKIVLRKIDEIERSVLKISCSAYYQKIVFDIPVMENELSSVNFESKNKRMTTKSVAGTGLILQENPQSILLITAFHLFDFEDTLKTYYVDSSNKPTNLLHSVSIKTGQAIFITHKNGTNSRGEILITDEKNDLALVQSASIKNTLAEKPFSGKFAKSVDVKLGEQVYLLGYPRGFFMVSRGFASPSKYKDKFVVDVSFNRGSSGSVVFTIDLKNSSCTYLGMANMMAYDSQTVLAPSENISAPKLGENLVYTGESYIKELKLINYGLTFVVKSDVINRLMEENQNLLRQYRFYGIDEFLKD